MKFVHYLDKIHNVTFYSIASFALFGLFFLGMLWYVWKADKKTMHEISRLPLDS